MKLPTTENAPLVRTDFTDDPAWAALTESLKTESVEGFLANLDIVTDRQFDGASPSNLAECATNLNRHAVLFIADTLTMQHPEHPILCLDLHNPGQSFRAIPSELWGVENNLSLANMDFDEFSSSVDADGIFRGFR